MILEKNQGNRLNMRTDHIQDLCYRKIKEKSLRGEDDENLFG